MTARSRDGHVKEVSDQFAIGSGSLLVLLDITLVRVYKFRGFDTKARSALSERFKVCH